MNTDPILRKHLVKLLTGQQGHVHFEQVVSNLPREFRGGKPSSAPYTPWQILEHMRIAQWDILEFSRSPHHQSPKFPEGYWPETEAPPDDDAWEKSGTTFRSDLAAMCDLVTNPSTDLFTPLLHGTGQTILREALLVADHNSYHLGQLVLLRRLLGAWQKKD